MTLELRPEMTASPEDLFGERKGKRWINFTGVGRLIRVADSIDDVLPETKAKGLVLTELWKSSWIVHNGGPIEESELTLFTDRVDEFVWISETEVEKFKELFEAKQ